MQTVQLKWTETDGWGKAGPGALGDRAQLLLLFGSSSVLQAETWRLDLQAAYPQAEWMGCSTAGEIYNTQVTDESLIVTVVYFEHSTVKRVAIELQPDETSWDAGDRLGRSLSTEGLVHVFVLSDGLQVNGSDLVRGISQHLPLGVALTGGLSGDGDRFQATWVIRDQIPAQRTIAVIGFYGYRLQVGYGSQGGWSPFGPERVITEASGNILYELDDRSALELYKTYLGDHAHRLPATGLLFPLSLKTGGEHDRLVRTILSVSETEQSLTFAGDMPVGSTAQLMHASFDRLVDGAIAAAETSQSTLHGPADLAILISCVGRKLVLQQRIEEEVEGVRDVLGPDTAITGFYSYGEIAPFASGSLCELHNQTMTITTFSER